jgi:hypothetical protein
MGAHQAIVVTLGAAAHMASCKAVVSEAPMGTSASYCILALGAVLIAEDCWFEGAFDGTLHVAAPAASATLVRCTLVRGGGMQPFTVRAVDGAAASLRSCQISVGSCRGTGNGSALSVAGGASLVLDGGTRVDATLWVIGGPLVGATGAGSSLAVRDGCSIVGAMQQAVSVTDGARATLDGSVVQLPGGHVTAAGRGTSLAVRSCTFSLGGPAGSSGEGSTSVGGGSLLVADGAKATVTATRVEGGPVSVRGEGSSLVHSGLACSGGVEVSQGGTARELPARAAVGGGGGQGAGCVLPTAAATPDSKQGTAVGAGGASGSGASASLSGTAEAAAGGEVEVRVRAGSGLEGPGWR